MYTATIIEKTFTQGKMTVKVEYRKDDDSDIFIDTLETTQPSENWPQPLIERRLKSLQELITPGKTLPHGARLNLGDPEVTVNAPATDAREEYASKLAKFEKYVAVLAKGFTTEENQEFVALKTWLTDNFQDEYIDMF